MRATAIIILLSCAAMIGCNKLPGEKKEEAAKDLPTFKEGKGLSLPAETRKSIGLETVEVAERKMSPQIGTEISVYRVETNMAFASGFVAAEQAALLKVGEPMTATTKDRQRFTGKLTRLDAQTTAATGRTEFLVEFKAEVAQVGMSLNATFSGKAEASVTVIPRSALLHAAEGDFVFVVNGDHLLRTPVKVGVESADVIEITDGLYSGDKVVVKPVQTLWLTELRFVKGGAACAD
jgi:hypothetical protein